MNEPRTTVAEVNPSLAGDATPEEQRARLPRLLLGALGVVFGDLGTSPLYTIRECFGRVGGLPADTIGILGVLSLVFWSLILVITVKFVFFIMRADNRGEGGVLALTALSLSNREDEWPARSGVLVVIGMLGAALFLGDGVITPAISVLSAVEGLQVATPVFEPYIVPISLVILVGLFLVQHWGTARVGALFGPVMCLWFAVIAVLGGAEVTAAPGVLWAIDPRHAVRLFIVHGWRAFIVLGGVVLAVTGAEALYADMGHFGRGPIRLAWLWLVLPALLLNYFGQGALLIHDPGAAANPFFRLAPSWALYPLVALATLATVIASQAVVSGTFSMTRQAVGLGFLPRFAVRHTSERDKGQIYIASVNWLLCVGVVALVVGFGSSARLAAAYGISVTGAMAADTLLACVVARMLWHWSWPVVGLIGAVFLTIDAAFLGANALKIPEGGWLPLMIAAALVVVMSTWRRGRRLVYQRLYRNAPRLRSFINDLRKAAPPRVPGTAVFVTGSVKTVPHALLHNLKHNKVLHERVVVLKVRTEDLPRAFGERLELTKLDLGFHVVQAHFGFMERPSVPAALSECRPQGLDIDLEDTSFFVNRATLIPSPRPDMPAWREQLFIALTHLSISATEFFEIPPDRVIEVGTRIEI